jgi:type II secretion system protein J
MNDPRPNGFTLLEILVAMTIFSITLVTMYTTFRAFTTSADLVKSDITRQKHFQQALDILSSDLEQIVVPQPPRYHPPETHDAPDRFRLVATETGIGGMVFSGLRFTSLNHLNLGPDYIYGVSEIQYYVHQKDGRFNLHRSDHPIVSGPGTDQDPCRDPVVIEDIDLFSLTLIDSRGGEHPDWDSESSAFDHAFPVQVAIQIQASGEDRDHRIDTAVFIPVARQVNQ